MARYEYRVWTVSFYLDSDAIDREGKRKQGKGPGHMFRIKDTGRSEPFDLTDDVSETYEAFKKRAEAALVDDLNTLGNDGWKLVSYTLEPVSNFSTRSWSRYWPVGTHLFMRELE